LNFLFLFIFFFFYEIKYIMNWFKSEHPSFLLIIMSHNNIHLIERCTNSTLISIQDILLNWMIKNFILGTENPNLYEIEKVINIFDLNIK